MRARSMQLSTIDELANQIVQGVDVDNIGQIIPQLMHRIEKFDLLGESKKRIVLQACELVMHYLSEEQKEEFSAIVKFADTLIDGIIMVANSKIFRKTKWLKCKS